MGCINLVVSGVSKGKGCLLFGMDEMLLYTSVIICCDACLWSACDAANLFLMDSYGNMITKSLDYDTPYGLLHT